MIALLLGMLRQRRGQAAAVVLAAAFLVAAAVAVPAYLTAADAAMVSDEWSVAPVTERLLTARTTITMSQNPDRTFESSGATAAGPGFTPIFSVETDLSLISPGGAADSAHSTGEIFAEPRLVFRDGACGHVRVVAGRCPTASGEVMISEGLAARMHIAAGQLFPARAAVVDPYEGLVPDRRYPVVRLAVVGVYRVIDPTEPYWADQSYFVRDDAQRGTGEPVFGSRGTLETLPHEHSREYYDYLLDRDAVRADRLPVLRDRVRQAVGRLTALGAQQSNQILRLLDRVDRDRATLRVVLPLAAVPLAVLGWLLLYFTVGYASQARRGEVGLVRLRGTPPLRRWWIAGGEAGAMLLVGAPLGLLAGLFGARAAAAVLVPDDRPLPTAPLSTVVWPYGGVGLAACLAAVLLATRAGIAGPVVNLLRRVPPRAARWRGHALEAAVLVLGVAAAVQLRQGSAKPTGVLAATPALVVLAVAVLAARLVVPAAAASGARAVRRGRLGRGLGALALARRPGVAGLLVLLILAVGELLFAAGTAQVAGAARSTRVRVALGAPQVLTVAPTSRVRLLDAVRVADPQGRYAMAVAEFPGTGGAPNVLAVDASRLARVATWEGTGAPSPARVAELLHPPALDPVLVRGQQLSVELTPGAFDPAVGLQVEAWLVVMDTGEVVTVQFGPLRAGRHRYAGEVSGCLTGCRLAQLAVGSVPGRTFTVSLVLHQLAVAQPGNGGAVPLPAGLDRAGWWRAAPDREGGARTAVAAGPDGLRVTATSTTPGIDARLVPADTPDPLPVISTAALPGRFLDQLGEQAPLAQRRAAATRGVRLDDPDQILDLVGLGGLGGARIGELAPGARQRAALAVGIAASPGLLLVDEPTSQLDRAGRDEVLAALETVNTERGTTVVVVTHDAEVGARLGRVVTIRDGRVGAEGRGGQDFAVVAGDGTIQLPPEVLGSYPPGTLFTVDHEDGTVSLIAHDAHLEGSGVQD